FDEQVVSKAYENAQRLLYHHVGAGAPQRYEQPRKPYGWKADALDGYSGSDLLPKAQQLPRGYGFCGQCLLQQPDSVGEPPYAGSQSDARLPHFHGGVFTGLGGRPDRAIQVSVS